MEIPGFYTIKNADKLPEFFMSLVSSGDHWMFISSKGALSAGRKNPESALFPYETVDKIFNSRGKTGTKTLIKVSNQGAHTLWEPFADWTDGIFTVERSVSKNFTGSTIIFREHNVDLKLSFFWSWTFSHHYGFIRRAWIENHGSTSTSVSIVDGFLNLMSGGVSRSLQTTMSCLTDAYKDAVLDNETKLAAYSLASIITDKAEPREALKATVVWHTGLENPTISLNRDIIQAFMKHQPIVGSQRSKGQKSDFLVHTTIKLPSKESVAWYLVADVTYDHRAVSKLQQDIKTQAKKMPDILTKEAATIEEELNRYIGAADGLSVSAKPMHVWHHGANTLFNIMRGGLPAQGMELSCNDVVNFAKTRNPRVGETLETLLAGRETIHYKYLQFLCNNTQDPSVIRIGRDYLPLTFSRRHGDPSRPWNEFSIRVRDKDGKPLLDYQGNWRDIFQNWEALGQSFPLYLEGFLGVFLDATSADGYNPYRVSRSGIDWEKVEPENPWSNIGYWNDHQIIYFQKLAESLHNYFPGRIEELLDSHSFAWANIPYRIAPYAAICTNPRSTISFDHHLDQTIDARVKSMGSDGRLLLGKDDQVVHATMIEKIITLFAAKLGNFVPEGGIWLNTQRPEWNDANNALAGYGLSMVTVYYLRRFTGFWTKILHDLGGRSIKAATPIVELCVALQKTLKDFSGPLAKGFNDKERKAFMDSMGQTLDHYRSQVYGENPFGTSKELKFSTVHDLFKDTLGYLDATIKKAETTEGLFHSYNLLSFSKDGTEARVKTLYPMLEGQVAVLSAGYLAPSKSLELLEKLRASKLYRPDQKSYLLYPDRELPDFFAKNVIPQDLIKGSALAQELAKHPELDIVIQDAQGNYRFGGAIENEEELRKTLEKLSSHSIWGKRLSQEGQGLLDLYEATFHHSQFTGRSGAMYAYEGLGSIYWHMVAKLLLAIIEIRQQAMDQEAPSSVIEALEARYIEVREGIGYQKTPEEWGAFPWDPYSHTPAHTKAQQPGMTGQVKEEVLTRLAEFGIRIQDGRIEASDPGLITDEVITEEDTFHYFTIHGIRDAMKVPKHSLAWTFCQVPFVRTPGGNSIADIEVTMSDGSIRKFAGYLDHGISKAIFTRDGSVKLVTIKG